MALKDRQQGVNERPFWYLDIAGIKYRFLTHDEPSGWTTPNELTNLNGVLDIESLRIPDESVQPSKPISQVNGLDFRLVDRGDTTDDNFLAKLFAFFLTTANNSGLAQAMTKTSGGGQEVFVIDTTGFAASGVLYIGLETVKYTGIVGAPTHKFTGVTRGHFNSQVKEHRFDSDLGEGVLASDHPLEWDNRKVRLYRNWLKPDGTAYDADYGGDHEELIYTGRIKDIRQSSHRERSFEVLTNPIIADLKRPVIGYTAETHIAGQGAAGFYIDGIDRLRVVIQDVANGTTRELDKSMSTVMGSSGPFALWVIAEAINDEIRSFVQDGAWPGRPGGNLDLTLGVDGSQVHRDEGMMTVGVIQYHWLVIGFLRIQLDAGPNNNNSILNLFGFTKTVMIQQELAEGRLWEVESENPIPRNFWSAWSDRLYVHDSTGFVVDQGTEAGNEAYVIVEQGEQKVIVPITAVNTADGVGRHYFTVDQDSMPVRPFGQPRERWVDEGRVGFFAWHEALNDDQPARVYQPLFFRNAQPWKVLLYFMLSSGTTDFNSATYDKIAIKDAGLDLEAQDIDIVSFQTAMRPGIQAINWRWLLFESKALETIMKPYLVSDGVFLTQRRGKITMRSWAQSVPLIDADAIAVDHSVHVGSISEDAGIRGGINAVIYRMGWDPLREQWFNYEQRVQNPYSVDEQGMRAIEIPIPAAFVANNWQGPLPNQLYTYAIWLLATLGRPLPEVSWVASRKGSDIWVGDIIRLTAQGIWNPKTGDYGYTSIPFQVTSRGYIPATGHVPMRGITMDGRGYQIGPYAPSGKVASYNAGDPSITLDSNAFSEATDARGDNQTDADFFKRIVDAEGTCPARVHDQWDASTSEDITITAVDIAAKKLTLSGVMASPPSAGDRVRLRKWDDMNATAKQHAFISDVTPALGAGDDGPFYWSIVGGRM